MLDPVPVDPPGHDEPEATEIRDKAQEAFNEAFLRSAPGVQLNEAVEAVFDLKAVMAGDPTAAAAIRVFQALGVAVKRKDAAARRALAAWERETFKYMRKHALDEHLKLPVPPRANLDRKFILDQRSQLNTVERATNGRREVSLPMAFRVARLLAVSSDDLLAGKVTSGDVCQHCGRAMDFTD